MIETLVNPKNAERKPWEMLFIGLLYAAISVLIADFLFLNNPVFEKHISMLIVLFTVIFSIPFFFYIINLEEEKDIKVKSEKKLIKEHGKALSALIFLFLGYVVAFSVIFVALPKDTVNTNFRAQLETYCMINTRYNVGECADSLLTGKAVEFNETVPKIKEGLNRVSSILSNNFYVLMFSLFFSFLFGAGAIFILAWNASVIAAAIGLFARSNILNLPAGFARYLLHGLPEITSYFIVALAGGIIGTAVIRHEFGKERFWHVLQDSLDLIILALIVLIIAAFMEVFLTPLLF